MNLMKAETREIWVLVLGIFAAFAIPYWVLDLGLGWAIGLTALWVVIAVVVRYFRSKRSS
jgi:hypothetical protein